jgi:hypothetical protein
MTASLRSDGGDLVVVGEDEKRQLLPSCRPGHLRLALAEFEERERGSAQSAGARIPWMGICVHAWLDFFRTAWLDFLCSLSKICRLGHANIRPTSLMRHFSG